MADQLRDRFQAAVRARIAANNKNPYNFLLFYGAANEANQLCDAPTVKALKAIDPAPVRIFATRLHDSAHAGAVTVRQHFDAFRHRLDAEGGRQRKRGGNDGGVLSLADAGGETVVDLQAIYRELAQTGQARITGAEIVERQSWKRENRGQPRPSARHLCAR